MKNQTHVFSINFIRNETFSPRVKKILMGCLITYLGANLLVMAALLGVALYHQKLKASHQSALTEKITSIKNQVRFKSDMELLRLKAARNLDRLKETVSIRKDQFLIDSKLARVVQTLPPKTWLTQVQTDRIQRTMSIQACFWSKEKNPRTAPIFAWIKDLKSDASFGKNLKTIELIQSSQRRTQNIELCNFELLAEWNKDTSGID